MKEETEQEAIVQGDSQTSGDEECWECDGTGAVDSGGVTPWGAGIDIPCPRCSSLHNAERMDADQLPPKLDENAKLREALTDMLSGWKYIRQVHGDLYGVGWDRAQKKAEDILSNKAVLTRSDEGAES